MLLTQNGMSLLLGGVNPVLYISDFIKSNTIFEICLSLVRIEKSIKEEYFLGVGTNN